MADFGAMFDKAKAAAETTIQSYRDADERSKEAQSKAFSETMKPLNNVVRPIIEQAKQDLAPRNVNVDVDHDEFYNTLNGKRIPALHFQLSHNDIKSRIYIFEIANKLFSCSADDGSKKPAGQRAGVFATDRGNVTTSLVEDAISRAITDITQAMERQEFQKLHPGATPRSTT
jgi:hypothetical protein